MIKKKGGLGRGLDALLDTEEIEPRIGSGVRELSVSQLVPNRFQPRTDFDDTGMEELTDSIRQQGIVQPVVVTPGGGDSYTIVAGERRWRAAQRAGLTKVPVIIKVVDDDRQLLELALVENLQRADLNVIEEAEAFRSLRQAFGLSQEQIGVRVGRSRAAISNALRLLGLPEEIQDLMRDGRLSAGQARPLLGMKDEKAQLDLARRAVAQGLSARQIEALAGADKKPRKKRARPGMDPDTAAAAERLTRRLQTKVEIRRRGAGGAVEVHFHSEEELMRLYDLLLSVEEPG